jgi:tetratricopeptide (TPR) repeat protein
LASLRVIRPSLTISASSRTFAAIFLKPSPISTPRSLPNRNASAHYNRASALQALGQSRDALQSFARVCAIDPGHYDAHRALGFLWLAEGAAANALDHFARTYELRRGDDRSGIAAKSLTWAVRHSCTTPSSSVIWRASPRPAALRSSGAEL